MTDLYDGERHRLWFYRGAGDPAGPYQVQILPDTTWHPLTDGTDPTGAPGMYVWVAAGTLTGSPAGTVTLASGRNRTAVRFVGADGTIDIDTTDPVDVRPL